MLLLFVIAAKIYWGQLESNFKMSSALVTDCHWGGRGTAAYIVYYSFKVNNKNYNSTNELSCTDLKIDSLKNKLVDKYFPVVYNPSRPSINHLLLEKFDYNHFKITIPDTLKETVIFLKCK